MAIINTGICGLDEMLNGGMPENSVTTLTGPSGSGKTIMSLQFLHAQLLQGKTCVYISSAHSMEELLTNSQKFGWDLTPYLSNNQLIVKKFEPVSIKIKDSEVHLTSGYLDELPEFLYSHKSDIVVLDSITEYLMLCRSDIERRGRLYNVFSILKNNKSSVLITTEIDGGSVNSKFKIIEYVADGIITLQRIQSGDFSELIHIIQITKMRWIKHSREIRQYEITDKGIEVYNKYQVMIGVGQNVRTFT